MNETFAANLDALAVRGVDTEAIRDAWAAACQDYQMFRDNNELPHIRKRNDAGAWEWIPFFGDHRAVDNARPMPDAPPVMNATCPSALFMRSPFNPFRGTACG